MHHKLVWSSVENENISPTDFQHVIRPSFSTHSVVLRLVDECFVNERDVSGVVGQIVHVRGGPRAETADSDENDDEELLEEVFVANVHSMRLARLELGENTARMYS